MSSLRRAGQITVIVIAIAIAAITANDGFRIGSSDHSAGSEEPSGFDFYVLALSWSPAFCQTDQGRNAARQCGGDADFGFITHGLWPQFEDGWPSFCQTNHGDRVPDSVAQTLLPIMPDRGLIEHQWDRHGTCSGLSQAGYAQATRVATQTIAVPDVFEDETPERLDASAIESAFMDVNEGLQNDAIAVQCRDGQMTEVRVCITTDFAPRACTQVDRNGCRQSNLTIVPR